MKYFIFLLLIAISFPVFGEVEMVSFSTSLFSYRPKTALSTQSLNSNSDNLFDLDLDNSFLAATISVVNSDPFSLSTATTTDQVTQIVGQVLNYPNPFRFVNGSHIGYMLSTDADINLKLFNMMGQIVFEKQLSSGIDEGAKVGYNRVPINKDAIGSDLSSGIYIYLLINKGKILGKGKVAVLP